ncbi:hypothetical protein [Paenibacillus turpanensis]|uniref:hypothetical protein n=1 Tax=Paenibacillus turpanensis TaxID=2689078 RepID=UPI00140BE987|nr:hypothetical protein [Paenibacillus turpanensis]
MKWLGEKKWMIGCIAMAFVLLILTANYVVINNQKNELIEETIKNTDAEWIQLYRLSETIDRYYIKNEFQDSEKVLWYVNQTCYHFQMTGRPIELNVNMSNFLILAYDPLFKDLALEKGPLNKEKASELFKEMNDELMVISRGIIDMDDTEKEKLLFDPTSSEFNEVNAQIKSVANKYTKLVDDYFKNNL